MRVDVMNSKSPELKWLVKKGRSSRSLLRGHWNADGKMGNLTGPKRVGDLSGSDSENFLDFFLGQSNSGNAENVPIKKRQRLLRKQFVVKCPLSERNTQLCSGDFSGIELLAAAASMDEDFESGDRKITVTEDSSLKSKTFGSSFANLPQEVCVKDRETERNLSGEGFCDDRPRVASSLSPCRNTEDDNLAKAVNRKHWDLNVLMDAWEEPLDSGSNELKGDNMETGKKESSEVEDVNDELFNVKLEANEPLITLPAEACIKTPILEPQHSSYPTSDNSDRCHLTNESEGCSRITDEKSSCYSTKEAVDISEDCKCFSGSSDWEKSGTKDKATQTGILCRPAEPADLQCHDSNNSSRMSEVHGLQNGQPLLTAESKGQISKSSTHSSGEDGSQAHSLLAKVVPNLEADNHPCKESKETMTEEGPSRSFIGSPVDGPTTSDGVFDFAKCSQQGSDVSQASDFHTVDGSNSAIKEGCNSPYEDGEVRGSYMDSWEENDIDQESDGRNDYITDISDEHVPELAERGSEVVHFTERRMKAFVESSQHIEAGSRTRSERPMIIVEQNISSRKRMLFRNDNGALNMRKSDEYASNMDRAKLQSCIERRESSVTHTVTQPARSHRQCSSYSYSHPKMDIKHGVKDGDWTSRKRHHSEYDDLDEPHYRSRPRFMSNESVRIGRELHSLHTDNYTEKGVKRSVMRRSSVTREQHFVEFPKRTPPAQVNKFRSRGNHYLKHSDGFDDWDYHHDDTGADVLFQQSSRRDQSFVPDSKRSYPLNLVERITRSRSKSPSPRKWNHHRREDYRMERPRARENLLFKQDKAAIRNGESYMPASRRRSSHRVDNYRCYEDSDFSDTYVERRRSPFKRPQTYGITHLKSKEYHRPGNRRFTYNDEIFEPDYVDRRHVRRGSSGTDGAGSMRRDT